MLKFQAFLFLALAVSTIQAAQWPQWRGPFLNGSTNETNLPADFSQTDNVAWSADLDGPAASTPIVWDDHVFLSSTNFATQTLQAVCFDRKTGQPLWKHELAKGLHRDERSNFAAPSPSTDGKIVVFFYSNGDLMAFDFAGKRLWERNIKNDYGEFAFQWTFSSSPLFVNGKLYLQVLQRDVAVNGRGREDGPNDSYLLAMDPKTGKTLWRHIRPSHAVAESRESFTTPIYYRANGQPRLLVIGGDALTEHDAATGDEIWRWETWNPERVQHWRHVPSPVVGDGIVLVCGPKREPVYAIKTGGSGQQGDEAIAWTSKDNRKISSDVPTPAFYDGDFFILSDVQKVLARVEPKTGRVKWITSTPGRVKYEASPLAADGKVYIINFDGTVSIFDAKTGTVLKSIPMDAPLDGAKVRASISASHGQLFIRVSRKLYCIGK